jgi:hypothetical protein
MNTSDKLMRFHLRVDDSNPAHVRFIVFANGANCGQLTMTQLEYSTFGRGLLIGCLDISPKTSVTCDVAHISEKKTINAKR